MLRTTPTVAAGSGGGANISAPEYNTMSGEDRRLVRDKWLAVAKAGLALMAAPGGRLLPAVGQAGIVGLDAYQQAQEDFDTRKLKAEETTLKRAALAARSSGGGKGGLDRYKELDDLLARLKFVDEQLGSQLLPPAMELDFSKERDSLTSRLRAFGWGPYTEAGSGDNVDEGDSPSLGEVLSGAIWGK